MIVECAVGWCATDTTGPVRVRNGVVCPACRRAWRDLVTGIVDAFDWLADRMVRFAAPAGYGSGPVSGTREPPAPMRVEMADQRAVLAAVLRDWAGRAAAGGARPGPAGDDPVVLSRWFVSALDWLAVWPEFPALAAAFSEALGGSYGVAPWGRTRRDLPVPCTACGVQAVSLYGGEEWIRCRACGHRIPWWRYERWVRRALAAADGGTGVGVVDDGRVQAAGGAA